MKQRQRRSTWQRLAIRIPYAWLLAFFLVPFLIVLKISLSQTAIAQPPYTPVSTSPPAGTALSLSSTRCRLTIIGCSAPTRSMCSPI